MGAVRVVGGRYELTRPLGRGGMGEVWAGVDLRLDRQVAVKLLRPGSLPVGVDHESLIARFDREARLTARLEHPGVPAVYDTGRDGDDLFLVLQLINGADLAEFQAENEPVPIGWVVAAGAQLASILGVAHAAKLVHRDLKPRNVMITMDGHVKVLDFGLAVLRDVNATRITKTAEALGTPAYMAPEQAMHGDASPASDMYSVGCVLYELLSGQPVFTANTPLALMHRHLTDLPTPVISLRDEVGPELDALVSGLLAKDPAERPTAPEVYDRLIAVLPIGAGAPRAIPMDPTRPFRDPLAAPRRPGQPTLVEPPPPFPSPPPPPPPPPPRRRGFVAAAKRLAEGFLIAISVLWLGLALIGLATDNRTAVNLVGLFTGIPLLAVGVLVRKLRMGNPHLWTIHPLHRTDVFVPADNAFERGVAKFLLLGGALVLVGMIGNAISERSVPAPILAGFLLAGVLIVPGLIMWLRRHGTHCGATHPPD
jgi:serine/threonine protein kinase